MGLRPKRSEERVIDKMVYALEDKGYKHNKPSKNKQDAQDVPDDNELPRYLCLRIAMCVAMKQADKDYIKLDSLLKSEEKDREAFDALKAGERLGVKEVMFADIKIETAGFGPTQKTYNSSNVMKAYLALHEGRYFSNDEVRAAMAAYITKGLRLIDEGYNASYNGNFYKYLSDTLFDGKSGSERMGSNEALEDASENASALEATGQRLVEKIKKELGFKAVLISAPINGARSESFAIALKKFDEKKKVKKLVSEGGMGRGIACYDYAPSASTKNDSTPASKINPKVDINNCIYLSQAKEEGAWTRLGFDTFSRYNDKTKGVFVGLDMFNAPVYIDFGIGNDTEAHTQIVGETGSGKSSLARLLMANFIKNYSKEELSLALFDPKGETCELYKTLNNSYFGEVIYAGKAGNKAEPGAKEAREVDDIYIVALDKLVDEMQKRQDKSYLKGRPSIIVMIDEASRLISLPQVEELLRRGRSARIKLVLFDQSISSENATQGARSNIVNKIALRLPKAENSRVALGESGAEKLLGKGDMLIKRKDGKLEYAISPKIDEQDIRGIL